MDPETGRVQGEGESQPQEGPERAGEPADAESRGEQPSQQAADGHHPQAAEPEPLKPRDEGSADAPQSAEEAHQELLDSYQQLTEAHEELSQAHQQLTEAHRQLKEAYMRLQADYDNFRRRTREEEARRKLEAAEDLILDLLPVYDNMRRAVEAANAPGAEEASVEAGIRSGVQLILQQLTGVLEKRGVRAVPGVGEPFDPRWHHAVAQDESSETHEDQDAPLVVVEEFQRGYLLGEKVIRPSLVQVGRRPRPTGAEAVDSGKGNEG